ncbi:MAG: hypothetical protein ACM3PY_06010 [Omnitrophica WOR_2 bacterium]
MQIAHVTQDTKTNNPQWYFLAEFLLGDGLGDAATGELADRLLFQLLRDLGIPPECLKKIEATMTGFTREAIGQSSQGSYPSLVHLRLFCQRKIIENFYLANTSSRPDVKQPLEVARDSYGSETKSNGGWGYFLVERGGDFRGASAERPHHSIDLYLYREGE